MEKMFYTLPEVGVMFCINGKNSHGVLLEFMERNVDYFRRNGRVLVDADALPRLKERYKEMLIRTDEERSREVRFK